MSTIATTPAVRPSKPPRRPSRWVLGFVLFLGIAPVIYFAVVRYRTQNDWLAAEEETTASDPRWRMAEILADREPIAVEDNLALAAMAILAKNRTAIGWMPRYQELFKDYPPNAQLNAEQIKLVRAELAKVGKPLDEARELRRFKRGRIPVTLADDFISTTIPHHQDMRILANWLRTDAMIRAHDEEMDKALDSCEASIALARGFEDDVFLIGFLIRIACISNAVQALERTLAQGEASAERIHLLQKRLETERAATNWVSALRGERAGFHMLFDNVRTGKVRSTVLFGLGGPASSLLETVASMAIDAAPSVLLSDYPDYLRSMNRAVAISKLTYPERKSELRTRDEAILKSKNRITRMLSPALWKVHEADARNQGLLLSTVVALACECYRLNHPEGRWPTSVEDLVRKGLLAELPRDPIDDQPVRYRKTKEGIVLYSIGPDEQDNAGKIDRENSYVPGVDIGFRLWNADQRRQKPLPAPAEPEVPR